MNPEMFPNMRDPLKHLTAFSTFVVPIICMAVEMFIEGISGCKGFKAVGTFMRTFPCKD
jgi:hypothetical protein